jgi:hypothetical protein
VRVGGGGEGRGEVATAAVGTVCFVAGLRRDWVVCATSLVCVSVCVCVSLCVWWVCVCVRWVCCVPKRQRPCARQGLFGFVANVADNVDFQPDSPDLIPVETGQLDEGAPPLSPVHAPTPCAAWLQPPFAA